MRWLKILEYYGYSMLEMVVHFKNWPSIVPIFICRIFSQNPLSAGILQLKLRRPPIDIFVRGAMDIWSVKETFLDQFYFRFDVAVEADWTVIDIGAGIGDFSLFVAYDRPSVLVYAFEPYPESFALLEQNLVINEVDNVKAFQKAVWSKAGELNLDFSQGEPLQITSLEDSNCLESLNSLKVEAVSLASLILEEQIKIVNLLKMDCEGAEYEILLNAPHETLCRVERIIMEYHDIDPVHTHHILMSFLKTRGYKVTCHPNIVHEDIGYLFATRT